MKWLITAALAFLAAPALASPQGPPSPKLVVVIAVDQFSADLFTRYRSNATGGLKRLATEGVVFPNGYQSHAATETCPGHATISTGRHPSGNGIIANDWYDAASGRNLYCAEDPANPVPKRGDKPRGPALLKASAIGEWLKKAHSAARVVSVSGKDRAAIMLGGHAPDGVFWWDEENGFTTSVPAGTKEAERLAPVAGFNQRLFASWKGGMPRLWPAASPRCAAEAETRRYGEISLDGHMPPNDWTPPAPGQAFISDPGFLAALRASPLLDQMVIDLAGDLMDRYQLGRGRDVDLLAISLSATDYIGHRYGNAGPEMCVQMEALDKLLGRFLARLEALKQPVLVVLSADHGSVDAAERVSDRGFSAYRLSWPARLRSLNDRLKASLGLEFDPLVGNDPQQVSIATFGDDPAARGRIEQAAVALLRKEPDVTAVFTRAEIAATPLPSPHPVDELTVAERFRENFDPDRSADIMVAWRPYSSPGIPTRPGVVISSHGTLWNYDRRVPILFWWPGAHGFEQPLPVETVDIAPTLAAITATPTPQVDGRCLDLDRSARSTCPLTGVGGSRIPPPRR